MPGGADTVSVLLIRAKGVIMTNKMCLEVSLERNASVIIGK